MSSEKAPTPAPEENKSTWKLPTGIEDDIYAGVIKSFVGVSVGGALGMVMFRSGKGWRAAGAAMGLGVAIGSTVERAMDRSNTV